MKPITIPNCFFLCLQPISTEVSRQHLATVFYLPWCSVAKSWSLPARMYTLLRPAPGSKPAQGEEWEEVGTDVFSGRAEGHRLVCLRNRWRESNICQVPDCCVYDEAQKAKPILSAVSHPSPWSEAISFSFEWSKAPAIKLMGMWSLPTHHCFIGRFWKGWQRGTSGFLSERRK